MIFRLRIPRGAWALCASAIVAACAHQPAVEAPQPTVIKPPETPPPAATDPDSPTNARMPSADMPKEWQNLGDDGYDDLFDRMRSGFTLDEVQENAVDQQLAFYVNNPDYLNRVFARSQRYLYHIVSEVEARGMPLEFALLPVVESAYEPFAYSPSRAAGLWQFIPETGRRFGLKQDWWYDGRRDVVESTRAALDYLEIIHDQLNGDWLLAIAAYNSGEFGVMRAVDRNKRLGLPTDFWHLKLPAETRAYVPKLLAMKRIMADPEKYGLHFEPIPNEPYFAVIDTGSQIDLKVAANLAGITFEELANLNPGYNRWATDPDGPHRLLVPLDNADALEAAMKQLPDEKRVRFVNRDVRKREKLIAIAAEFGTSVAVIAKLNNLKGNRVTPGQTLRIPQDSNVLPVKVANAAARVDRPVLAMSRHGHTRHGTHRVRGGDSLWSIARRNGMDVATLASLNGLAPNAPLMRGQRLIIRASARQYRGEVRSKNRRVTYRVRRGDTVSGIARRFQVSIQQIKNWNGINRTHQIRAGQRLVVYVDANRRRG
jgi:membrane-bound lytic murein transglycosylase D